MLLIACAIRYWAAREQLVELVPWWGVMAYAIAASALISLGRSEAFAGNGAQSRYVSLSALFWIALAVIALRTVRSPRELGVRALAVVAAVLVFWGASPVLYGPAIGLSAEQDEAAAGLRFNAADPFGSMVQDPQSQISRLQALHDYPYNGGYTVGCGLKPYASVDMSKVRTMPASAFPRFGQLDSDQVIGSTRQLKGWIFRQYHPTRCALLVDGSGKVVGGGSAQNPAFRRGGDRHQLPGRRRLRGRHRGNQHQRATVDRFRRRLMEAPAHCAPTGRHQLRDRRHRSVESLSSRPAA